MNADMGGPNMNLQMVHILARIHSHAEDIGIRNTPLRQFSVFVLIQHSQTHNSA
jgi:hypothetical protein